MRSGTSFFNATVFKKTVFRFWPLWAGYFVIWLVLLPLNGLMTLSTYLGSSVRDISYMEYFACQTVPGMVNGMTLALAVIFGGLCAMAVLSHLYNARSANFFGTLPVRREGLFLTHYLAGLAFLIVPNLIIALLTLLIEGIAGWVSLQGLGYWLAVSCGECFLFYSMAVFCGVFTGHILALPVFYAVLNVISAGVYMLSNWIRTAFFYGYTGNSSGWGYNLAVILTPVWKLEQKVHTWYQSAQGSSLPSDAPAGTVLTQAKLTMDGLNWVGFYVAAALVLAAGAFLIYRARRLESAGDVVSVRPMRPVFKYGVAICAGFTFGLLTCNILHLGEIGMMVAIVIWGVAGYFVAQMLLDKSFRVLKKWKGAGLVAAAFVVLFLALVFDVTGYETRMPDRDSVESVDVTGLNAVSLGDYGDYVSMTMQDPEQIELLMTLHQAAIDQRDGWQAAGGGGMRTDLRTSATLRLDYHLKNGSTLARSYQVYLDPAEYNQEGTAAWAMEQLYADRDLYWDVYGFSEMERFMDEDGWWMEQAQYEYYKYEEYETRPAQYYYGKDAQALFDAMKEDFFAGRIGVRTLAGIDSTLNEGRDYEREIRFAVVDGEQNRFSVRIFVQDTAASTIAALEALNGEG